MEGHFSTLTIRFDAKMNLLISILFLSVLIGVTHAKFNITIEIGNLNLNAPFRFVMIFICKDAKMELFKCSDLEITERSTRSYSSIARVISSNVNPGSVDHIFVDWRTGFNAVLKVEKIILTDADTDIGDRLEISFVDNTFSGILTNGRRAKFEKFEEKTLRFDDNDDFETTVGADGQAKDTVNDEEVTPTEISASTVRDDMFEDSTEVIGVKSGAIQITSFIIHFVLPIAILIVIS